MPPWRIPSSNSTIVLLNCMFSITNKNYSKLISKQSVAKLMGVSFNIFRFSDNLKFLWFNMLLLITNYSRNPVPPSKNFDLSVYCKESLRVSFRILGPKVKSSKFSTNLFTFTNIAAFVAINSNCSRCGFSFKTPESMDKIASRSRSSYSNLSLVIFYLIL